MSSTRIPPEGSSTTQAEHTGSSAPTRSDRTDTYERSFGGGGGCGSAVAIPSLVSPTGIEHTDTSFVSSMVTVSDELRHEEILREIHQTYQEILPGLKTDISFTKTIEKENKKGEIRTNIKYSIEIKTSNDESVSHMDRLLQLRKKKKKKTDLYMPFYTTQTRVQTNHSKILVLLLKQRTKKCFFYARLRIVTLYQK